MRHTGTARRKRIEAHGVSQIFDQLEWKALLGGAGLVVGSYVAILGTKKLCVGFKSRVYTQIGQSLASSELSISALKTISESSPLQELRDSALEVSKSISNAAQGVADTLESLRKTQTLSDWKSVFEKILPTTFAGFLNKVLALSLPLTFLKQATSPFQIIQVISNILEITGMFEVSTWLVGVFWKQIMGLLKTTIDQRKPAAHSKDGESIETPFLCVRALLATILGVFGKLSFGIQAIPNLIGRYLTSISLKEFMNVGLLSIDKISKWIIEKLVDFLMWLFHDHPDNPIYKWAMSFREDHARQKDKITAWQEWLDRVDNVIAKATVIPALEADGDFGSELRALYLTGTELRSKLDEAQDKPWYSSIWLRRIEDRLKLLAKHTATNLIMDEQMRTPEPVCILIAGPPGIGKTTLINQLVAGIMEANDIPSSTIDKHVCFLKTGVTRHLDQYKNHSIVILDDAFSKVYSAQDQDRFKDIEFIINAVSATKFTVPKADIDEKGMIFTAQYIIVSTNYAFPQSDYCAQAFFRRFSQFIIMSFKEEDLTSQQFLHRMSSSGKFDSRDFGHAYIRRMRGCARDLWENMYVSPFSLQHDHPENEKEWKILTGQIDNEHLREPTKTFAANWQRSNAETVELISVPGIQRLPPAAQKERKRRTVQNKLTGPERAPINDNGFHKAWAEFEDIRPSDILASMLRKHDQNALNRTRETALSCSYKPQDKIKVIDDFGARWYDPALTAAHTLDVEHDLYDVTIDKRIKKKIYKGALSCFGAQSEEIASFVRKHMNVKITCDLPPDSYFVYFTETTDALVGAYLTVLLYDNEVETTYDNRVFRLCKNNVAGIGHLIAFTTAMKESYCGIKTTGKSLRGDSAEEEDDWFEQQLNKTLYEDCDICKQPECECLGRQRPELSCWQCQHNPCDCDDDSATDEEEDPNCVQCGYNPCRCCSECKYSVCKCVQDPCLYWSEDKHDQVMKMGEWQAATNRQFQPRSLTLGYFHLNGCMCKKPSCIHTKLERSPPPLSIYDEELIRKLSDVRWYCSTKSIEEVEKILQETKKNWWDGIEPVVRRSGVVNTIHPEADQTVYKTVAHVAVRRALIEEDEPKEIRITSRLMESLTPICVFTNCMDDHDYQLTLECKADLEKELKKKYSKDLLVTLAEHFEFICTTLSEKLPVFTKVKGVWRCKCESATKREILGNRGSLYFKPNSSVHKSTTSFSKYMWLYDVSNHLNRKVSTPIMLEALKTKVQPWTARYAVGVALAIGASIFGVALLSYFLVTLFKKLFGWLFKPAAKCIKANSKFKNLNLEGLDWDNPDSLEDFFAEQNRRLGPGGGRWARSKKGGQWKFYANWSSHKKSRRYGKNRHSKKKRRAHYDSDSDGTPEFSGDDSDDSEVCCSKCMKEPCVCHNLAIDSLKTFLKQSEQGTNILATKILQNMTDVGVILPTPDKKTRTAMMKGFFVSANTLLVPGHLFDAKLDSYRIIYTKHGTTTVISTVVPKESIVHARQVAVPLFSRAPSGIDLKNTDLALIYLPTINGVASVRKNFCTEVCQAKPNDTMMAVQNNGTYLVMHEVTFESQLITKYNSKFNEYSAHVYHVTDSVWSRGDCGSLLINQAGLICGIYVAGCGEDGYYQPVTQELLKAMEDTLVHRGVKMTTPLGYNIDNTNFIITHEDQKLPPHSTYAKIRTADPKSPSMFFRDGKTDIERSIFSYLNMPITKGPADLSRRAFYNAWAKRDITITHGGQDSLEIARRFMEEQLSAIKPCKSLSWYDALNHNGYDRENRKHLELESSPGFPYILTRPKGEIGKEYLFDKKYYLNPVNKEQCVAIQMKKDLQSDVDKRWNSWTKGECLPAVFTGNLKDEKRPLEKVKSKSTRLFLGSPVDLTICARRVLGEFTSQYLNLGIDHAIGIDPTSLDWHKLVQKHMNVTSSRHGTSDCRGFDSTITTQVLHQVEQLILHFFPDPVDKLRISCMFVESFTAYTIFHEEIYLGIQGVPSGMFPTSIIDSLANSLLFYTALFTKYAREHENDADKLVDLMDRLLKPNDVLALDTYGDDLWYSVGEELSFWNQTEYSIYLKRYGLDPTPPCKTGKWTAFTGEKDIQFLKRTVNRRCIQDVSPDIWVSQLEEDSIISSVQFQHRDADFEDLANTVENAVREMSFYGYDKAWAFYERLRACKHPNTSRVFKYVHPFSVIYGKAIFPLKGGNGL
nr:MAG: RNA-dependent RNA polymerase [Chemarfal virus 251]